MADSADLNRNANASLAPSIKGCLSRAVSCSHLARACIDDLVEHDSSSHGDILATTSAGSAFEIGNELVASGVSGDRVSARPSEVDRADGETV